MIPSNKNYLSEQKISEFVDRKFFRCVGKFLSWLSLGETYWFEYIGNDHYIIRSDNKLGKKFEMTQHELFTNFFPVNCETDTLYAMKYCHWLGELGVHKGYIDDIYNAYSKFQSEKSSESGDNEDLNILQRFSFYSYKDEPNILYLAGLYVNDKHRNKGIGTKILKIANEVAISIGCNIIRLKTQKDTDAEKFYRKNGYNILTEEGNQVWLEKQSTLQVRTGLEWINTVDDACDKRYSEEYAHGEYCHEQSFKWGFQEGVEWFEEQGGQKPQSARESAKRVDPKFKVGNIN
jgi:GNAT superfamily N-acetyltransferase